MLYLGLSDEELVEEIFLQVEENLRKFDEKTEEEQDEILKYHEELSHIVESAASSKEAEQIGKLTQAQL